MSEHLGGYVAGGDPATFYPDLWTWLVKERGIRSVVDVGCGEGHSTRFFAGAGAERVLGIDGVQQPDPLIYTHDYTRGSIDPRCVRLSGDGHAVGGPPGDEYDLVWSCEFVEHVERRYLSNLGGTFRAAPLVLMTHAFPGQPGHHHVNCREPDYWVGVLAGWGFQLDESMTAVTRALARMNTNPINHYARSGMAFRRS